MAATTYSWRHTNTLSRCNNTTFCCHCMNIIIGDTGPLLSSSSPVCCSRAIFRIFELGSFKALHSESALASDMAYYLPFAIRSRDHRLRFDMNEALWHRKPWGNGDRCNEKMLHPRSKNIRRVIVFNWSTAFRAEVISKKSKEDNAWTRELSFARLVYSRCFMVAFTGMRLAFSSNFAGSDG